MGFWNKFKSRKNRIFAISFSSLALALFFAYYGMNLGLYGGAFFTSDFSTIWNFLIVAIAYFMVFIYNINNDSRAYFGVSMFIFMIVIDQIFSMVMNVGFNLAYLFQGSALQVTFNVLSILFLIGQIAVGIMFYVYSRNYVMMRDANFKRIRLLGILFAVMLALSESLTLASALMAGIYEGAAGWLVAAEVGLLPLADINMAVASIFTMERLRRY